MKATSMTTWMPVMVMIVFRESIDENPIQLELEML